MGMTPDQVLETIEKLRARGARMVKVHPDGGVEAIFEGPAPKVEGERDVEAETEARQRAAKAKAPRSLDERLLRPLGIKREDAA